MERYRPLGKLGDGTYGRVYKARDKKTSEVVAIKQLKTKFSSFDDCLRLRELQSLRALQKQSNGSHVNIIDLKEVKMMRYEL